MSTLTALLVLDMVSEFRFPEAERVLRGARRPARAIARLKARARNAKVPVIYVNDTAGQWESDPRAFVQRCLRPMRAAATVVGLIEPDLDGDYFMFKPKHSAFFGTPLESLLGKLGIRRLVLTGITSHQCVLFTAMDAHVREYELVVPADCVGAGSREETRHALFIAERALRCTYRRLGPNEVRTLAGCGYRWLLRALQRQAHRELAAPAQAQADGLHRASMQSHQLVYEREADAESATRHFRVRLSEHLEYARQHFRRDALAGVFDVNDCVSIVKGRLHPDSASRRRVLDGVLDQVGENLEQPGRIGQHHDRRGGGEELQEL